MNTSSYTEPARLVSDAQLQALIAVVECGSFTAAGRQLGMSQSAVSHAVTALETSLRVELLRRDARGIQLTEVGERMLTYASEVLRLKGVMHKEAESARRLQSGVVRVGSYGPTSSRHLLPPLLQHFAQRYPKLEVRIFEGSDQEVESWLHEQRIDVGFLNLPNEAFHTHQLACDELVVVMHESCVLAGFQRIRPEQLQGYPFIMATGGCEPAIRAMIDQQQLDVQYRIREVQTIVELVGDAAGIAIKPMLSLPAMLPSGVVCRPLEPVHSRKVGVAWSAKAEQSPAVQAFLRIVKSYRQRGETAPAWFL